MRIRQAFPCDIPAVADVILESMSFDPEWMPFFRHGARKNGEYSKFVNSILKPGAMPAFQDILITVAELDDENPRSEGYIVAVAVWDISPAEAYQGSCPAKGGEKTGLAALVEATARGRMKYFGRYERCMHLRIMATRPHYQQQGYAKALCEWGIGVARKRGMGVTVLTGLHGYVLFSDLGFVDIGPFPVRLGGCGEEIIVKAMALAPDRRQRRGSFLRSLFGLTSW